MLKNEAKKGGFSLVESLVALAIFVVIAMVIYQTSALMVKGISAYRDNVALSNLADEYMEVVHNLPYSTVGTLSGNPHGSLPDLPNATQINLNGSTYQIYYVVNYISDPADPSSSPDYKQVKLYIKNITSGKIYDFVTTIVPKDLESLPNTGALSIEVFNAVGQPVPDATINITNTDITPNINLTRTTNASGDWIEVGLPDSVNGYHIVVTKNGYSSDQTYTSSASNPNPIKPDSTIANGQVTQISFSIDQLSSLSFSTLDQLCSVLPNIGMEVQGAKLIGSPNILKFDHDYTSDSNGNISLGSIEWDNYTPILTDPTKMVYGSSPIQVVTVLPDTAQSFTLILGPKTTNSLLVIVKDSTTNNPIENADVQLEDATDTQTNFEGFTGGNIWSSNDWSGGSGQADWSDDTKYFSDDGHVSTNVIPTALRLLSYDGGVTYTSNGSLISSTFDTGTASTTYTTLDWQPTSQNPATLIQFQIATSNTDTATTTWNFIGPDGTNASYYTTPGTTINSPSARYLRYEVFLSTTDDTETPVLTSVNINYVSGCFTPGQVFFPGLQKDSNYQITVSAPGYATQTISPLSISGYQSFQVSLSH